MATGSVFGQKNPTKKYPSLFWEITGNGLEKPSYLFGTMHVSSKMVFHLSDSFYYAMKNVDAVALELNPDLWQGQMVRLDRLKENYANFVQSPGGDFLTENSFSINDYDTELKAALSTEPTVVNSLLYRSFKTREDFEEDTFLDLYIFQTGKRLGKRSAGVEDYNETEKVVLEAYGDMAKEKKKKNIDFDGESMRDIGQKIQNAYRSGDLDLMDSLDLLTERSDAFREKFLYKRNEIQAGSIDTILKQSSLFVGVGAAHLPGPRGIIELLRKMGYHLRPIKMSDRDAVKKDETDQLKVPVVFSTVKADDGSYSVSMPGPLFKMKDEYMHLDRRQYSDMSNGSFYLVTRVKTYAAFLGQTEDMVLKKVDSLLYEYIPGKILKKSGIQKNGYKGFDLTNKTRRGDLQRYNILITPFEILIFKMSGKENYADGKEAAQFFSSIQLKENTSSADIFTPAQGGFSVRFPQSPDENLNANTSDGINRWEYQAKDNATGDVYLVLKKSVHNFKFLDEDSFDLKLIEESFRSPDYYDKQISRKLTHWLGYPCLEVKERMKNGHFVTARYLIKGPHYYCIAVSSKDVHNNFSEYFNSFHFTPYQYRAKAQYVDSFMHFSVTTPIAPELDLAYRAKLEKVTADVASSNTTSTYNSYWPKSKNALFASDSTGEAIGVSVQQYPKYYSVKDSANFWTNTIEDIYDEDDLLLYKKDAFTLKNGVRGYRIYLKDTGSSRILERMIMLKDNYLFSMVTISDTVNGQNDFTSQFFSSFAPEEKNLGKNIFVNNLDSFFADLFSKDSTLHKRAQQTISNIYYGEKGVTKIVAAIRALKADKDYVDTKTRLIAELGYIKDTTVKIVVGMLKKIYEQTADTSTFQNEVLKALARHKSKEAIQLFKELVLQDPPFFENNYEYTGMFTSLSDSLELAATLYPELLQLAGVDDYKKPVLSLLKTLVDSGQIKENQYEDYFNKIYFDAKIELKKQQGKDEKKLDEELNKDNDDETIRTYNSNEDNKNELTDYAVLLMPFYDKNSNVPKFFDKLLRTKDEEVKLNTSVLLLRNNKMVADSILNGLAREDKWRGKLYKKLEQIKRLDKFPVRFKTQLLLAKSYLVADKDFNSIDSIVFIGKQNLVFQEKKGFVYFFKYRVKKEDDWKIGLSGLQPEKIAEVSSDNKFAVMTDKKLKPEIPFEEQYNEQLKRVLFTFHKSARNFFESESNYRFSKTDD
ncbi:MAG: lipoprotein [Ferruginibacter sp.]|nr:lipoprotein [Ferruginibacter sp.]